MTKPNITTDNTQSTCNVPMEKAAIVRNWLASFNASSDAQVTLFLIGIKDLKQINDRLGRGSGDIVIQKIGNKICNFANNINENIHHIARMPGREFLIIHHGLLDIKAIENIARSLLELVSVDLSDGGAPLHISARIGIAVSEPEEKGEDLLLRANSALALAYSRKGKKMAIAEYHPAKGSQFNHSIDLAMRAAIQNSQIAIVLQPQFEVVSGRLVGAEALARLHHPLLGEIGADELFAAADLSDLREELSHMIQEQAIKIAASWPAALSNLRISVNLGAEEIGEHYAENLLKLLEQCGFEPRRLTLELTEESLIRDLDKAAEQLEKLRKQQVRIALDDFGTGYSSLAYLKILPLDYLKIDKSMTPDINGTAKDRIVLRAIIAMAKALGLQIIAEGVEQLAELEMLKAEECEFFQGYLRAPPLSPAEFERFAMLAN